MIDFIFTIDYEIYGNGGGSLDQLVYEPTERLASLFRRHNATFVVFAEALEFIKIEAYQSDTAISRIRTQLRGLHAEGFEIGLHLHPWWSNARWINNQWCLDYGERNLCLQSPARIDQVVGGAIDYLRQAIEDSRFKPISFRSGLWLMQPTSVMASVLAKNGVQVDSSVFKGGRTRSLGLDYRPSLKNGYYWHFSNEVNHSDPGGQLLEIPIYSELVPFWKMLSRKRLKMQGRVPAAANGELLPRRMWDMARFRYPRKLDFCRMKYDEMLEAMQPVIRRDRQNPSDYKPIVAIGHSKDLVDFETIDRFLGWLQAHEVRVSGFQGVIEKLRSEHGSR